MDANAIQIVSDELRLFLAAAIGGPVYVGPPHDADAHDAAAVLFLYRIAMNASLRNEVHRIAPGDPTAASIAHRHALPLDLYYLLTAGTADTGGELSALRTLGLAMQALNDAPALVGFRLQSDPVRVSIDPISSEEMSRIWSLFPTANYRTSVVYLATPVWIDPAALPVEAGPVTEEPHRFLQRPRGTGARS